MTCDTLMQEYFNWARDFVNSGQPGKPVIVAHVSEMGMFANLPKEIVLDYNPPPPNPGLVIFGNNEFSGTTSITQYLGDFPSPVVVTLGTITLDLIRVGQQLKTPFTPAKPAHFRVRVAIDGISTATASFIPNCISDPTKPDVLTLTSGVFDIPRCTVELLRKEIR